MNVNILNGSQFCKNCKHLRKGVKCIHPLAKQVWATNQRNGCDFFKGDLVQVDWSKAIPMGYRPSTFSK